MILVSDKLEEGSKTRDKARVMGGWATQDFRAPPKHGKEAGACSAGMGGLTGRETSNYRGLAACWAQQSCRKGAGVVSNGKTAGGAGPKEGRTLQTIE